MDQIVDMAIIGAGPYGLSLAAHLKAAGISFRIFGKPMSTWRDHMPKGMHLKSDGFASNLSAPGKTSTLKSFCEASGRAYGDAGRPVELDTFLAYADWFASRHVPELEALNVTGVEQSEEGFRLTLEDGEVCRARQVVLAVGITAFKHIPEILAALPRELVSHSFDHHDVTHFKDRDVIVLGAGASAIDTAVAIREAGAKTRIVARSPSIVFHCPPRNPTPLQTLRNPPSGIGPGWRSFLYVHAPLLFHAMPRTKRLRIVKRHLGPAPGWFMRERVEGRIETVLGRDIAAAKSQNGRAQLTLDDGTILEADHIVAATGYKPALGKLSFLGAALRAKLDAVNDTPVLTRSFETSVKGLYAIGPLAANSFGPLMRFMVGSEFAAPHLTAHLMRRRAFAFFGRMFQLGLRNPAPSRPIAVSANAR
jgi:thioredoxin reductase